MPRKWFQKLSKAEKEIVKNYSLKSETEEIFQKAKLANQSKQNLENTLRQKFADKFNQKTCQTHTFPTIHSQNPNNTTEHEASTGQISEEISSYLESRGLNPEQTKNLFVSGFCADVLALLPMEFAVEARRLVQLTLEKGFG